MNHGLIAERHLIIALLPAEHQAERTMKQHITILHLVSSLRILAVYGAKSVNTRAIKNLNDTFLTKSL